MDDAQRRVAVLDGIDNDPHCEKIIDLVQGLSLIYHFLIDAEKVFDTAVHPAFDAGLPNVLRYLRGDLLHIFFPLGFALRHLFNEVIIYVGFKIFERKVIQFYLDLGDSEPGCDGGIDIERLLRDADLLLRRHVSQCAHIVEAVGQFDQNDADILGHCQEHLSQISCLFFLLYLCFVFIVAGESEFFQFGDAVHKECHVGPEQFLDLFFGHDRVFHYIVKKTRRNSLFIKFQIRKDQSHVKRVNDVGLAGFALLPFVGLSGNLVAFLDQRNIV